MALVPTSTMVPQRPGTNICYDPQTVGPPRKLFRYRRRVLHVCYDKLTLVLVVVT